jgi:hypothetical protein
MTRLEQLAEVLRDGEWHTNVELVEKAGHRFGAAILQLKKGEHDGNCWEIERENMGAKGLVRYCLVGFRSSYRANAPKCPKCGTQMEVQDVRHGGSAGEYTGARTTAKHTDLLEAAYKRIEELESVVEWQADIIRKETRELKNMKEAIGHGRV